MFPTTSRFALRDHTHGDHRRTEAAFAPFDLAEEGGYAHFLAAHLRIVPGLETAVEQAGPWSGWMPRRDLLRADYADLTASPAPPCAFWKLDPVAGWGVQYVLEGSRLGGRVLLRRLPPSFPRRYLAAPKGDWACFQAELEQAAGGEEGEAFLDAAIAAARWAFLLFERAAAAEMDSFNGA